MTKREQIVAVVIAAGGIASYLFKPFFVAGAGSYDTDKSMDRPVLAISLAVGAVALMTIAYILFFEPAQ